MKVHSRALIDVGNGTASDIAKAIRENKIPNGAIVTAVELGSRWVDGLSSAGSIQVRLLKFEWDEEK